MGLYFHGGAEIVVDSEFFSDGFDPDFRAGGTEHDGAAEFFLFFEHFEHFSVKCLGEVLLDKLMGQFLQFGWVESPEVVEEDPFHTFGAEDFVQREEGDEDQQIKPPPGHTLDHKVTE